MKFQNPLQGVNGLSDSQQSRELEGFTNFFMNETENLHGQESIKDQEHQAQLDEILQRKTTSAIGKQSNLRRAQGDNQDGQIPLTKKRKSTKIDQEMIIWVWNIEKLTWTNLA